MFITSFLILVYASNVTVLLQYDLICMIKNKVAICNHHPD